MIDRRAVFFAISAIACFLLIPIAFEEHRWVAQVLGVTYVVLAIASALDARSRSRS